MKLNKFFSSRSCIVSARKECGASSLEYLMLGAVIVAILIAVMALTEGESGIAAKINTTFSDLFDNADPGE
ncbi:hypothetical protein [Marinobacter sp. ANT_B65]|uniref:hypothetical protein n=1 Tax=Marinobacter sp. ANT_B65 TaxID=2039467 RepID=UPI000BBF3532|nr:hypothetical protein [Marinobacter sp. ANT_B65]PCM44257.1 hypothetical protein CPA50_12145 [Marinobacter sp. ANT_B65]